MNIRHISLITRLELIKRVRSTRWVVALAVWALVLLAISAGTTFLLDFGGAGDEPPSSYQAVLYLSSATLLIFFILFIGLTIAGANAAGSINGDRTNATLALLQVSPASGGSIVVGKLLAAWIASMTFLLVAVPFVAYLVSAAPETAGRFILTGVVLSLMMLAVAGIGVGMSTLTSRQAGSTVLVFLVIIALFLASPVLTVILERFTATSQEYTVSRLYIDDWDEEEQKPMEPGDPRIVRECEEMNETRYQANTDGYWWLNVINPVVITSDALPRRAAAFDQTYDPDSAPADLMLSGMIMSGVEYLAKPSAEQEVRHECGPHRGEIAVPQIGNPDQMPPDLENQVWPWGVGLLLLTGGVFTWIGIRRTQVPVNKLGRGERIA